MVCLLVVVVFLLFPFLFDRQNTAKVYRTSTTFLNLILKLLFSSIFFRNDLIACLYPCSLAGNGLLGRITDVSRTLPGRIESLQLRLLGRFGRFVAIFYICATYAHSREAVPKGRRSYTPAVSISQPELFRTCSELPPNMISLKNGKVRRKRLKKMCRQAILII